MDDNAMKVEVYHTFLPRQTASSISSVEDSSTVKMELGKGLVFQKEHGCSCNLAKEGDPKTFSWHHGREEYEF